jgi:hypothetical protein
VVFAAQSPYVPAQTSVTAGTLCAIVPKICCKYGKNMVDKEYKEWYK